MKYYLCSHEQVAGLLKMTVLILILIVIHRCDFCGTNSTRLGTNHQPDRLTVIGKDPKNEEVDDEDRVDLGSPINYRLKLSGLVDSPGSRLIRTAP